MHPSLPYLIALLPSVQCCGGPPPFSSSIPVGGDWIGKILPLAPTVWGAAGFNALSAPIQLYLRILSNHFCHYGVKYHQHTDDIQLYISVLVN